MLGPDSEALEDATMILLSKMTFEYQHCRLCVLLKTGPIMTQSRLSDAACFVDNHRNVTLLDSLKAYFILRGIQNARPPQVFFCALGS